MKSYRLTLVFCLLAVSLLACAWVLGFISEIQMFDMSGRVLGVLVILGVCGSAAFALMRMPSANQNETRSSDTNSGGGPKF